MEFRTACPRCNNTLVSENGKRCFVCGVTWHHCAITNRLSWAHPESACFGLLKRYVYEAAAYIEARENGVEIVD